MITFIVASSAVMVIYCCILVWTQKSVVKDFGGGGGVKIILKHLYRNDYAEFVSKISNIIIVLRLLRNEW